jgi:hypothetical protein
MPVSTPEHDTALLLLRLQKRLSDEGHLVLADTMGKVAERLGSSRDIDAALEQLYSVQGWSDIGLRLMWYLDRSRSNGIEEQREPLLDFQVEELHSILMSTTSEPVVPEDDGQSGAITGGLFESLHEFATALDDVRLASFEGERVPGMQHGLFDSALSRAGKLHQTAGASHNEHLVHFSAAVSLFLRYLIEREYFDDVRAIHLIDVTADALHKLFEQESPEAYAAIEQATDMLHNSETLLE